jgi:cytochrome c-type biogenesis protein CcmH/NrfG
MAQVGDDPQRLASEAGILWNEKKDPAKAIACALRIASHVPKIGVSLLRLFWQSSPQSGIPEMRQLYAVLSRDAATRPFTFNNWGNALTAHARTKVGDEADWLFAEAGSKYAEAVRLKPDDHVALNNWGNALSEQARAKAGEEADRLYTEAAGKYAEAVRVKADFDGTFYNWGNALHAQATTKTGEEADRLFAEAATKYADALRLKPDDPETLYNWGTVLYTQAETKGGEQADRLFAEARQVRRGATAEAGPSYGAQ